MVDHIPKSRRSWLMSRVRGKDTQPELVVRKCAHSLGLRFRLHRSDLPGRPDLVFPGRGMVIFVHGCFWHRHRGCRKASVPSTRHHFWMDKFQRNVSRDAQSARALRRLGWSVATIWECQTKDAVKLENLVRKKVFRRVQSNRKRKLPGRHTMSSQRSGHGTSSGRSIYLRPVPR